MIGRRGILASLGALALAICLAPTGAAAAGLPPSSALIAQHQHQSGGLVWEEWTSGDRRGCVSNDGDGTGEYPHPLAISPGPHLVHFVLGTEVRPKRVRIVAHRTTDQTDPGTKLDYELRPRLSRLGAITAWRIYFRVTPPPAYYLDLYAK